MNMKEAMRETLELARQHNMHNCSSDNSELDFPHLQYMYDRVLGGICDHNEARLGRWLGWMQAAVVAQTDATLEDMKQLNRKWSDK